MDQPNHHRDSHAAHNHDHHPDPSEFRHPDDPHHHHHPHAFALGITAAIDRQAEEHLAARVLWGSVAVLMVVMCLFLTRGPADALATAPVDVGHATGHTALLAGPTRGAAPIAHSPDALYALERSLQRSGDAGAAIMSLEGSVQLVERGSPVRVLRRDGNNTRVRILEGEHAGSSGWVRADWLRKD